MAYFSYLLEGAGVSAPKIRDRYHNQRTLKSNSSATKKQPRVLSGEILATRCSRDPFTYLVYIVPFSDMLRCQCLKTTAEPSTHLFGNPFRPLETLATSALTKALQSLSVATSLFNSSRKMLTIIAPLTCEWIEQCDGGSDWGKGIRLSGLCHGMEGLAVV